MNHKLVLELNVNYLLYMLYLILLNFLSLAIVSLIRLIFGFNATIFGKKNKKSIKRQAIIGSLALLVGMINAISIFFYMFSNININFVIISFIPILLVICLSWSIRISFISAVPSVITYLLVGSLYLQISFFDLLTPIFALLIMFTGTIFCKVYNIKKYWQVFLMQVAFSLFCAIVMSITLNSADNIYIKFNGELIALKNIKISEYFASYFINIFLVNFFSCFINLCVFMLCYMITKKLERAIKNVLTINNLSYYLDGIFLNNKIGMQKIQDEIKNDEFYLSINIYLPNISSTIKEINFHEEKEIKSRILSHLEVKFKNYNPIYYKNRLGFYCLLISLKNFNISNDLTEIYEHKNEKFNELYGLLENYVTTIKYNNKEYPYIIKNFMCLYGIHTYSLDDLEDITYKLYNKFKNSDKNLVIYDPAKNFILNDKINFADIPEIDKSKLNICFLENPEIKNIIEPNISYTPYLLITKDDFYQYLDKIDKTNKIKRYLALEVLKKFKDEREKYESPLLVIDYPEETLLTQQVDIQYLIKRISELGYETKDIIFRFSDQNLYEDIDFINVLKELSNHNIKIWLSRITSNVFLNQEHLSCVNYISYAKEIKNQDVTAQYQIKNNSIFESNFTVLKEYI